MANKQIVLFAACTVLLVIASAVSADPSETAPESKHEVGKSYFGYQPKPKDSYKKLTQDVEQFGEVYNAEFASLIEKIAALHKKLYHRKDKDHGGYNYNDMEQILKVLKVQPTP